MSPGCDEQRPEVSSREGGRHACTHRICDTLCLRRSANHVVPVAITAQKINSPIALPTAAPSWPACKPGRELATTLLNQMKTTDSLAADANAKFAEGYNCAQSVVWALAPQFGLDPNIALRISTGFGAGMGRQQEVCGAVTGRILVLGLKFGRDSSESKDKTEKTYALTRALLTKFAEQRGHYNCRALLHGCDLQTSAGQTRFKDEGMLDAICKPCVRSVVEIVSALVAESETTVQ